MRWTPPLVGSIKINIGGSCHYNSSIIDSRGLLRDSLRVFFLVKFSSLNFWILRMSWTFPLVWAIRLWFVKPIPWMQFKPSYIKSITSFTRMQVCPFRFMICWTEFDQSLFLMFFVKQMIVLIFVGGPPLPRIVIKNSFVLFRSSDLSFLFVVFLSLVLAGFHLVSTIFFYVW